MLPVKFFSMNEDNPPYRKVQAHADSVCGHHYLGLTLRENAYLPAPDLRGKTSVDDADLKAAPFQAGCDIQHHSLREDDQRIAFPDIFRKGERLFLADQLCLSLISVRLESVSAQGDQMGDDLLGGGTHAYMNLVGLCA